MAYPSWKEIPELNDRLLRNIKRHLHEFKKLQGEINDHWGGEDGIYRLYHHSFKVYRLQDFTERTVKLLDQVDPKQKQAGEHEYHAIFQEIVKAGTNHTFVQSHNEDWTKRARPIAEAFLHCQYLIDMIVKYGKELKDAPNLLPSGWAAVLSVFRLR
jgi:hypothetical protein